MQATPSESFVNFLSIMGQKINLAGWPNYRGDFGKGRHVPLFRVSIIVRC
jgi:hypothetical protein